MTENGENSSGIQLRLLKTGAPAQALGPVAAGSQRTGENGRGIDLEAGHGTRTAQAVQNTDPQDLLQDHKDSGNRYLKLKGNERHKDHYLRPDDGKLDVLKVQRAPNYTRPGGIRTTWEDPSEISHKKRLLKAFRNASIYILGWTYTDWLKANGDRTRPDGSQDYGHHTWKTIYWKYPVACLGLTLTGLFGNIEGSVNRGGKYPPVRYRYFGYPTVARNLRENQETVPGQEGNTTAALNCDSSNVAGPGTSQSSGASGPSMTRPNLRRQLHPRQDKFDGAFGRHLRPRKLCIIPEDDQPPQPGNPYNIIDVDEWDRTRRPQDSGEYVFVSYTRHQYQTYMQEEIDKWKSAETEEHNRRSHLPGMREGDLHQLYQVGITAAQKAGVNAFWIDILCMNPEMVAMDVHRICDIARGAKCLVIALKDKVDDRLLGKPPSNVNHLLENWASRLWTLPEMLLAPTKYDIGIYRSSSTSAAVRYVETIAKRNIAERAYIEDGLLVRQLVDHFEGNLILTQTELLTIGLECLVRRLDNTKVYAEADPIYALMTLARRRPPPKKGQSLFEAFAWLSLLNDSNMLLERLICILPPKRGQPWYKVGDYWHAKLWDIFPTCQIAGIAADQTVILDGAFGASIEWGELKKVGFLKRKTIWRKLVEFIVRFAPGWIIIGIMTLVEYAQTTNDSLGHTIVNPYVAVGIISFLIAVTTFILLPHFMLTLYRGKFWSTQALFIGLEGVPMRNGTPDLDWLEQKLFGFSEGRLKWSPYGSTQSRHRRKTDGERLLNECEAVAPSEAPLPLAGGVTERQYNQANKSSASSLSSNYTGGNSYGTQSAQRDNQVDQDRIFTLVDTYTLTVTTFRAVHPPSVVLVCGLEGGMQRAVLCSYDYKTQTFHRETVLRMPTKVLDRMDRVDRLRFSIESLPL